MKAMELSFNLIALLIMSLLVVFIVAAAFTGQSSQVFIRLSGFGKSTTTGHIDAAGKVCLTTGSCKFMYADYEEPTEAREKCNELCNKLTGEDCRQEQGVAVARYEECIPKEQ